MKITIFSMAVLVVGSAFAQQKEDVEPFSAHGPVTFLDSRLFDRRLSKELDAGKDRVEVDLTSKVSLSSIPSRIDRWLVAVAEEGNVEFKQVDVAPQRTRFIFGLLPLLFSSLKAIDEERMYRPSTNYNVIVYYKKGESGDATIEQIIFHKKQLPKAGSR